MSFLTPLYIAGALAVALPVLFHLIRRTPRGEIPFSSLMFLSPSPPRITRRSRIEHWLLLVLRGLALVLLAAAFARPFWRQPAQAQDNAVAQRRVAVVVDASASMRRGDLWRQAVEAVDKTLAALRPQDQFAVFACDETLRPVASFEDLSQIEPTRRRAMVAARLAELSPTWAGTHLGQALLDALALVNDSRDATEEVGRASRTVVLVSDLQGGGRANVLGDYPWPADVELELKRVAPAETTNAGLWRLADDATADERDGAAATRELRIRVANAADSDAEQFRLQWTSAAGAAIGDAIDAYVPPGESRVVRVAPPAANVHQPRLQLQGDAHDFDNLLYFVPEDRRQITIEYLGADRADDPQQLRYYLERAVTADPQRDVRVASYGERDPEATAPNEPPPLIVATDDPPQEQVAALRQYVVDGGTLLYVLDRAEASPALAALLETDELPIAEAKVDEYALLEEIDFDHPLFASMAGPKFNDFTQIRFWMHRTVHLAGVKDVRVVAQFDGGDPAIFERRLGAGRLVVMTAGWQPSDGQLARSWKFVLMLSSLIHDNGAAAGFRTEYLVNERVPLPDRAALAAEATVTKPDGVKNALAADATAFAATDVSGTYELAGAKGPIRFAVNLDPAESDTAPLPDEAFEQLGVRLAGKARPELDAAHLQQLRDVELESRQRLWQWLVAAALGALILETWWAGRLSRRVTPAAALA